MVGFLGKLSLVTFNFCIFQKEKINFRFFSRELTFKKIIKFSRRKIKKNTNFKLIENFTLFQIEIYEKKFFFSSRIFFSYKVAFSNLRELQM